MSKLIGISNFTSKAGKSCHVVTVLEECTARDNDRGSYGQKVESIWLDDLLSSKVSAKDIGREIKFDYSISGGRAYAVDLSLK